jgi:hypothetical protein
MNSAEASDDGHVRTTPLRHCPVPEKGYVRGQDTMPPYRQNKDDFDIKRTMDKELLRVGEAADFLSMTGVRQDGITRRGWIALRGNL